jgi:hypothetical protein
MELSTNEDFYPPRIAVPRGVTLTLAGYGWFPHEDCAFDVTLDDLMPDIRRLMKSVASGCIDGSNVCLHFDELVSELHLKFAQILRNRSVTFESRERFFGFLKVSFQRHLKSVVQKYALTFKRTGVRPRKPGCTDPAEEAQVIPSHCHDYGADDTQELHCGAPQVAIDDRATAAHLWLGETDKKFDELELSDEVRHFVLNHLTDDEKLVFFQEAEPNDKAMNLAFGMTAHNRKSRKFRILDRHKADGIDMSICAYKRHLEHIREKLKESWKFNRNECYEHTPANNT